MSTETRNSTIFRLGDLPRNVADRVVSLPRELARDVTHRGREVWLAGLGALATAEEEGTTLFNKLVEQGEKLVERGEQMEEKGKQRIETVREDLTARKAEVSERIEKVEADVSDSVMSALKRFGVPTRVEVESLSASVAVLSERVETLLRKLEEEKADKGAEKRERGTAAKAAV